MLSRDHPKYQNLTINQSFSKTRMRFHVAGIKKTRARFESWELSEIRRQNDVHLSDFLLHCLVDVLMRALSVYPSLSEGDVKRRIFHTEDMEQKANKRDNTFELPVPQRASI